MDVPGLYYIKDFVSEGFGTRVLECLDGMQWRALSDSPNSRKVQHYGYLYDYATRTTNAPAPSFPTCIEDMASLLLVECRNLNLVNDGYRFNQCIVNNYEPGQGISRHIDLKSYGGVIGCFTFGSGAVMRFHHAGSVHDMYVEPNSLYIMSEDARWIWSHEMPCRKSDIIGGTKIQRCRRVSVTFRKVDDGI